jgi:xanthine dehydrogenase accessory factor
MPSPSLFAEIVQLQQGGRRGALATPMWLRGSVPLSHQQKLLVRDDGSTVGTVGGGAVEAAVLRAAGKVISTGRAEVLEFDLDPSQAAASGMICGGECAVLVEPIAPDRNADAFGAVAQAEARGEPAVVITLLEEGGGTRKLALREGGQVVGAEGLDESVLAALRAPAEECLAAGMPRMIEEPVRAHLDPIMPRPPLFVFGAGHIAVPLAQLADLVGFAVAVVDDRAEFASRARFPRAAVMVMESVADAFARLNVSGEGYVVAVTRGHALDEEVVAHALRTPARYIGMIGSKRKVAEVRRRLRERGFLDSDLARIHAPIGLAIGAKGVEEIAVSIVAELIAVRRDVLSSPGA